MEPRRISRVAAIVVAMVCVSANRAGADWLFTPFLGGTFGMTTTFNDYELAEGSKHVIFGGSGAWLARDRILGGELDFSYSPHFFETGSRAGVVLSSNVGTFTASVIAAAPLSLTRESLRPYLVGGAGVIHATIEDVAGLSTVHDNLAGIALGGGVLGFLTRNTGVRFDLRHYRTFSRSQDPVSGTEGTRLSFWRATVGVTIRY